MPREGGSAGGGRSGAAGAEPHLAQPKPVRWKPAVENGSGNGSGNGVHKEPRAPSPGILGGLPPPRTGSTNSPTDGGTPGGLLKEKLQLRVRADGSDYEVTPLADELQFDKGFFVVVRALQLLLSAIPDRPIVIGLGGPSGAGKTEMSTRLQNFMPMAVISMDNYIDTTQLVDGNFDDPRLTDFKLLAKNLDGLRNGLEVETPLYSFKESKRVGYTKMSPPPNSRVVLIEGIYALHEQVRPFVDLSVAIHGGVHFDLVKRILRDVHRSNQAPREIIQQISETVFPMYKAFIEPDLQSATIRIRNTFNPFAGFLTKPTYTLKSDRLPDTAAVLELVGLEPTHEARIQETCDIYLQPPGEDLETCKDWIRMRLRDGRYSLVFEEYVTEGNLVISPSMSFEVPVRVLSGLMSLGYQIGAILKRQSKIFPGKEVTCKVDEISQLNRFYFQVEGKDRATVEAAGTKLGLDGSYIPRSYIEQVQLERLLVECMPPEEVQSALAGATPHRFFSPPSSPGGTRSVTRRPQSGRGEDDGENSARKPARRALMSGMPPRHERSVTPMPLTPLNGGDVHVRSIGSPSSGSGDDNAVDVLAYREQLGQMREAQARLEAQLQIMTAALTARAERGPTAGLPPSYMFAAGIGLVAGVASFLMLHDRRR